MLQICLAQPSDSISVRGYFLQKSTPLGQPVPYVFVAQYPLHQQVFFVDSTYDFAPFEWVGAHYYPSRIRDGRMYDSLIYYLAPFTLQATQRLKMPFYYMENGKQRTCYTSMDSLRIEALLSPPKTPQEAQLKAQLDYQPVALSFDFLRLFIVIGATLVLCGGLYYFCRRPVAKWWTKRALRKKYLHFSDTFAQLCSALEHKKDIHQVEHAVKTWKTYLELLEKRPYRKLSTKEISILPNHIEAAAQLQRLDHTIYANRGIEQSMACLRALARVAERHYIDKLSTI